MVAQKQKQPQLEPQLQDNEEEEEEEVEETQQGDFTESGQQQADGEASPLMMGGGGQEREQPTENAEDSTGQKGGSTSHTGVDVAMSHAKTKEGDKEGVGRGRLAIDRAIPPSVALDVGVLHWPSQARSQRLPPTWAQRSKMGRVVN
jgi:hypothetical protein